MTKFTSNENGGWQQKLQNSSYQRVALQAGVRNLDSQNDVKKIEAYLAKNPKLLDSRYIDNAAAAGIRNLDSQNDIRQIDEYLGPEPPKQPSSPPKPENSQPIATSVPTPMPTQVQAPAPQAPAAQADYSSIFQGYQDTLNALTASYNAAITDSSQAQQSADEMGDLQQQNESLRQANQRFLDMSANDQLSALRSGTTTGGNNSSVYGSGGAGLTGGTTQYRTSRQESSIGTNRPAENSVLSRKSPVVQQLSPASSRQRGSNVAQNSGLTSGRASNYYASRFS